LHHHRVLRTALQHAVKWRLLAINPVDATEPPRPQHQEIRVFSEEEIARVVNATKGTPLALPILVALCTGLRRGEVLGLRWEDVDVKRGTLAVRQSLEETREGLRFKVLKTKKSRRVVAMPSALVDALIQASGRTGAGATSPGSQVYG
jgi:integrase